MGHLRLSTLPRTERWGRVLQHLDEGAPVNDIAKETFWAAYSGLTKVPADPGFTQTLTTIFNFVDALQSKNAVAALRQKGFDVTRDASLFDFIGSFQERARQSAVEVRAHSDLAQIC